MSRDTYRKLQKLFLFVTIIKKKVNYTPKEELGFNVYLIYKSKRCCISAIEIVILYQTISFMNL